jgi:hypothetical protein
MEIIQDLVKQKVHGAPFSVQGWDGVLGAHSRTWSGLFGPICVRL